MRVSIYSDILAALTGAASIFVSNRAFSAITDSLFHNGDGRFDRVVILFTQQELQSIFLALSALCCGLLAGLIARRRGFLIGFCAFVLYSVVWYVHAGLRYHPIFVEPQWINVELATAVGWGIQSGVAGIAGVALICRYFASTRQAS